MSEVLYEERGRVAIVTWNRPDAMNTFTYEMRVGLIDAFKKIAAAEHIRAVVLTGAGRGFSAGADLNGLPPSGVKVAAMLEEEFGRIKTFLETEEVPSDAQRTEESRRS